MHTLALVLVVAATAYAQVPRHAQRIRGEHVDGATYATAKAIAPGTRFSIVVELTPKPGMHVYAPGAHTYKVVALELDPHPFLSMQPLQYPASEKYLFKPLNEMVDVYQKRFRLVQDLMIDTSPDAGEALGRRKSVTITGTLRYQACDERICFLPQSVPVRYRIAVRPAEQNLRRGVRGRRHDLLIPSIAGMLHFDLSPEGQAHESSRFLTP
jgi:hypothetical protein